MTVFSFADLDQWVGKVKRRQEAVLRQATNNMMNDIEIVPGMARGGSPQMGTIPRDLGALANSKQTRLLGSTSLAQSGEDSHVMVLGAMALGDVARITWGGNVAPYAKAIHDGSGSYPGTFWVDVAAGKWPDYVKAATQLARATIQ